MKFKIILILVLIITKLANAQFNEKIINQKLVLAQKATISETLLQIGESFLGTPYEGGTLEGPEEKMVCKLDAFDCYTFVENVLAISLTKHANEKSFDNYINVLQNLRYRNGEIKGYPSRIHYFLEWVKLAEKRRILLDMTPALGRKTGKKINFMSQNRKLYPSFASNNELFEEILNMEKGLEKYPHYQISKTDFKIYEQLIKPGDIIAFTSTIAGLDVNHEGIAVRKNGKIHLMHASQEEKKVIVSEETLAEYLFRIKKHAGIMIVRVNDIK
jgi:hypothetical protein